MVKYSHLTHINVKSWLIWKDPDAGEDWKWEEKGTTELRWLDGITDMIDMILVDFGSWWWTGRPGVLQSMGLQSRTQLSDWTELNTYWYNAAICNIVTELCYHHHNSRVFSSLLKESLPPPPAIKPPIFPTSFPSNPWQSLICFLSLWRQVSATVAISSSFGISQVWTLKSRIPV